MGWQKDEMWAELLNLLVSKNDIWIIFGDFNVVRYMEERVGSSFSNRETMAFNDFIAKAGLHDF